MFLMSKCTIHQILVCDNMVIFFIKQDNTSTLKLRAQQERKTGQQSQALTWVYDVGVSLSTITCMENALEA